MARKVRNSLLESRSSRLKLAVRRKPYSGSSLGSRHGAVLSAQQDQRLLGRKVSDGHGQYWTKAFAEADDFDASDGKNILDFYEAQAVAKALARRQPGEVGDDSRPATVAEALDAYEADLKARGGSVYNAAAPRGHLSPSAQSKPVQLLDAKELRTVARRPARQGPAAVECRPLLQGPAHCAQLWPPRTIRASRTSRHGKPGWRRCRTRRSPATSSSMIATVSRFIDAELCARCQARPVVTFWRDRRKAIAGGAPPGRGPPRRREAAPDDARSRQGRQQKPWPRASMSASTCRSRRRWREPEAGGQGTAQAMRHCSRPTACRGVVAER